MANQPGEQPQAVEGKAVENDFETTGSVEEVKAEDEKPSPTKAQEEPAGDEEDTDTTDQSKVKKPTSGFKKKIARLEAEKADLLQRLQSGQKQPPAEAPVKSENVAD